MSQSAKNGYHLHFLVAAVILSFSFFIALGFWPPSAPGERATEGFRRHDRKKRDEIARISCLLDTIHHVSEMDQRELMAAAVSLIRGGLLPDSEAQEKLLYAAVDRRVKSGLCPFTEALRFERRQMGRWTEELALLASEPLPDHNRFCLRGERLLGLVESHLDAIEEILLPILDRSMTSAQFHREVGSGMGID